MASLKAKSVGRGGKKRSVERSRPRALIFVYTRSNLAIGTALCKRPMDTALAVRPRNTVLIATEVSYNEKCFTLSSLNTHTLQSRTFGPTPAHIA